MKKTLLLGALTFSLLFADFGEVQAATVHYKDVKTTDNFYYAVENLLNQDAISSKLPDFHPYNPITRGQAASIIVKVLGLDITNVKDPHFTDVPTTHQFYPYIAALQNEGIIGGYSDKRYGVNDPLKRGQMTKILVDGFNIPLIGIYDANLENYSDVDRAYVDPNDGYNYIALKDPFGKYIYTMDYYGYVSGYKDNTFRMNTYLNRSQLALMIEKIERKVDDFDYFFFKDFGLESKETYDTLVGEHGETRFISLDSSIISIIDVIDDTSFGLEKTFQPPVADQMIIRNDNEYAILKPHKAGTTQLSHISEPTKNGRITTLIDVVVTEENGKFNVSIKKAP